MPLEFVEPPTQDTVNVLLYGPPGSGKTTGAASAPGPILYLNADVGNATRYARVAWDSELREAKVTGLSTLVDAVHELQGGKYASVVVDPLADVYRLVLEDLSGRAVAPKIQHYGDTGTHLERFARAVCDLPVNAVFVAHEVQLKDEATGTIERLPYTGTNNPALGAKLMAMVDVVGYTGIVPGTDDEPDRYVAALRNENGRRGKARAPFDLLGRAAPLDLSGWVGAVKQAAGTPQNEERKVAA